MSSQTTAPPAAQISLASGQGTGLSTDRERRVPHMDYDMWIKYSKKPDFRSPGPISKSDFGA